MGVPGRRVRGERPPRLDLRYRSLRDGLRETLRGRESDDPSLAFGGPEPARIAAACLEATRPVVEELLAKHAAGRIRQSLIHLAWSYAHLHCNRLGIDVVPEAILRYLMFRFHEDASSPGDAAPDPDSGA